LEKSMTTVRVPLLFLTMLFAAACKDPAPAGSGAGPTSTETPKTPASASAAAASPSATVAAAPAAPIKVWGFDADPADKEPAAFQLAKTKGGKWRVKADPTAPSPPNVLAQLDADKTDPHTVLALAPEAAPADLKVTVRCKLTAGKDDSKVDSSCGLVFRLKDESNYYLARISAHEKEVSLFAVKDGKRTALNAWKGATIGDVWHELGVQAVGDHLEVFWDGTRVVEATDSKYPDAGKVGLWTRTESVAYFDSLSIFKAVPTPPPPAATATPTVAPTTVPAATGAPTAAATAAPAGP
jgi:hypothetical protein